jgi:hypothetical protein
MERNDMNNHSTEIASWLRAGIVGIAFSVATVQAVGADSLRPTVDTGGSGGGLAVGTLDETVRATNLIATGQSASSQPSDMPSAAYAPMPNFPESVFVPESHSAFVVHPNLRSIQLIEGKQAVAEVAQPASVSAYAICLACSSFG